MRYAAETGTALALARKENIRLDMEGVARLASKNLLPDPTLSDFNPDGTMRYWPRLEAPAVPTGRNVYIREPGGLFDRFTRQNNSSLPRDRAGYGQRLALVNGVPMPGRKSPYDVPPARVPHVEAIGLSDSGYPAATYLRAYAWAIRAGRGLRARRGWLLTDPGPPVEFTTAEDQSTEQPLPTEVPEGVDGIALLDSEPDGVYGRLFIQRIIDVRDFVPESYPMDGPPRYSWRAPQENQTYIGALNQWPAPRVCYRPSGVIILPFRALLSYRFRTERGWSAAQKITVVDAPLVHREVYYKDGKVNKVIKWHKRWAVFVALLPRLPRIVKGFELQIKGPDGQWQSIDYGQAGGDINMNFTPRFMTNDSEKNSLPITYESAERTDVDETGIPGPDEALEAPLVFGKARIGPGRKVIRTTDVYTNDDGTEYESPPSSPKSITLAQQEGLRIDFREKAEEGNIIPNGDFEEQVASAGYMRPRRFFYTPTPHINLKVSAQESVVTFDDSTNRATDENILTADKWQIYEQDACVIRGGIILDRANGGAARLQWRFYSSQDVLLGTYNVVSQNLMAGPNTVERVVGPVGSGADFEIPAGSGYVRSFCQLLGTGANGARDLAGRFVHVGMFRGKAAPRKVEDGVQNPVPETEPENAPYPSGSYMRVVENPSWSQGKGNGFEYYGSLLARLRRRYFASGLQVPVEANRAYCFQADYFHEGLQNGSEVAPVSVMNAKGEVLADEGPLLVASGNGSGQTFIIIETGPDAAYLEIGDSTLGFGLLRMWGFQLAYATAPSQWTNEVAPSGVIAAAFDTRTPGVDDALIPVFAYKRMLDGGTVADLPFGTNATVRYRGRDSTEDSWSVYYDDITTMPRYRYIEVEATPQTTDLTESPEISSLFAEAEPPRTVLLRADGSEYPGGVLVEGMPATQYPNNTEESMRSDGRPRTRQLYPARPDFEDVTVKAYSEEGVEAVSYDATHGSRLFQVKGWGKSRLVRITNMRFGVNRMEKVMGKDLYVHVADDVSGRILQEIPLAPAEAVEAVS